jgi:ABC-type spermidine/putrescine transport system permease subunit I
VTVHPEELAADERAPRPPAKFPAQTGSAKEWSPRGGWLLGVILAAPAIILVVLFVFAPLARVFADAMSDGAGSTRFIGVFQDEVSRRALVTTLTNGFTVTLVTIMVGSVIAWYLHVTERAWLRGLLWLTALIPFAMGVIVKNYAVLLLLVANGPVNRLLEWLGLIDEPLSLLYTSFAVVYGISYSLLPYAVLTLYAVFSGIDKTLLSSASILGASRMQIIWTVVLPLARGGILVAAALVFVLSIGFYVTPILLGGLQTPFIATVISQQIFMLFDYPGAAATSAVVLVIALAVVVLAIAIAGASTFRKVLR